MDETIHSMISFQDIFEKISNKLIKIGDNSLNKIIEFFTFNPKKIIISTNIENSFEFERMKFYDPLYSSNNIRKFSDKVICIDFRLDEDILNFENNGLLKENAFMKFRMDEGIYEWRECLLSKNNSNGKIVANLTSDSLRNKCNNFFCIFNFSFNIMNILFIFS
jgi:hypothetical protein